MPGTATASRASVASAPCATCPGGRAGPGGAYAFARPTDWPAPSTRSAPSLQLSREPESLAAIAAGSDDFSGRAAELLKRISWPGKASDALPSVALTASQQQQFERGREVYRSVCQGCHQPDGRGLERLAPSLIESAFALAPAEVPVRILLHGKEGGTGLMPPVGGALDDQQIADVLTYVRREWGQRADPIDPATVAAIRAASAGRTRPWTEAELTAVGGGRGGPRE
jgi:mono/diheme cytochrome c family protein